VGYKARASSSPDALKDPLHWLQEWLPRIPFGSVAEVHLASGDVMRIRTTSHRVNFRHSNFTSQQ
jgi:hypothetical protein